MHTLIIPEYSGTFLLLDITSTGPRICVLIREVSLFQRLICTQKYTMGPQRLRGVLISEV